MTSEQQQLEIRIKKIERDLKYLIDRASDEDKEEVKKTHKNRQEVIRIRTVELINKMKDMLERQKSGNEITDSEYTELYNGN